MLNLFSVFDPYMGYYFFNWNSSFMILFFVPQIYWFLKSRLILILNFFLYKLWLEFKILSLNFFNINNLLLFISLFMFILMNNFMGLFPYIFTSSSHLLFSLSFSLSLWLGLMFFGWIKNMNFMFIHLVPLGTPFLLMFFMVMIETLSNIIRPLTLSIRLVANMVAGHLLLTLLSMFIPNIFLLYILLLMVQLLLLVLEIAVSLIQSYVYVVLLVLYMKETN